jgi:hypothetical protein
MLHMMNLLSKILVAGPGEARRIPSLRFVDKGEFSGSAGRLAMQALHSLQHLTASASSSAHTRLWQAQWFGVNDRAVGLAAIAQGFTAYEVAERAFATITIRPGVFRVRDSL